MNKKFFIFCLSSLLFLNFGISGWFTVAARCTNGSFGGDLFLSEKDGSGSVGVGGQRNFSDISNPSNIIEGSSREFRDDKVDDVTWSYKRTETKILVYFSYEGETYTTDIDFNPESMSKSFCGGKFFSSRMQEAYDSSNGVAVSVSTQGYYSGKEWEESWENILITIYSEGDGFSIQLYAAKRIRQ